MEEEDDPCLVSLHLTNRSNKGLALAVSEVLQKHFDEVSINKFALSNDATAQSIWHEAFKLLMVQTMVGILRPFTDRWK